MSLKYVKVCFLLQTGAFLQIYLTYRKGFASSESTSFLYRCIAYLLKQRVIDAIFQYLLKLLVFRSVGEADILYVGEQCAL